MRLGLSFAIFALTAAFGQNGGMPPPPKPQTPTGCCGPMKPAIADANPAVRHPLEVKVPTRLTVRQNKMTMTFAIDQTTFEPVKISVGDKMVTGVKSRVRVYPVDEKPDDSASYGLDGQIRFSGIGPITWPLPTRKSIVEIELQIFETDIPSQHMWHPETGKYKVLWQRSLKQTIN